MYGALTYIILSEFGSLLDTWQGTLAAIAAFVGAMLLYSVLLCILVARQINERKQDSDGKL